MCDTVTHITEMDEVLCTQECRCKSLLWDGGPSEARAAHHFPRGHQDSEERRRSVHVSLSVARAVALFGVQCMRSFRHQALSLRLS